MMTGRQVLQDIQKALGQEQQRLKDVDSRLSRNNDEVLQLDSRRATELQRLARLRLQFLSTGQVAGVPDDSDRTVLALIETRNQAYQQVQQRLSALEADAAVLEARAGELADERQRLTDAIGAAEEATQKRLEADLGYQAQLARAHETERVAAQADAKATQSEEELENKGAAYRADRLFMYLWERGHGTSAYRPGGGLFGPLIRWLDDRVARLIGYADARPNFHRLQELPERLREHAERVEQRAEDEFEKLRQLDLQGRVDDGIPELETQLEEAQRALDELHEAQTALAGRNQEALAELGTFAQGTDTNYHKAVELLRSDLEGAPLQVLKSEALATPSPEDDVIVARLRDLNAERDRKAQTGAELKESASQHRKRLADLEKLRADYTRAGMDQPNSGFRDTQAISGGLNQFLTGLLTIEALWRLLNSQRVRTPTSSNPDFGSGGFGRGTVWGGGTSLPRGRGSGWGGTGADVAGDVIGEILGGLLGGLGGSGSSGSSGGFGGSGRSSSSRSSSGRSSSGSSSRSSGGSRSSSSGSGRSSGGFRTGGRVGGGKFKTGGKF